MYDTPNMAGAKLPFILGPTAIVAMRPSLVLFWITGILTRKVSLGWMRVSSLTFFFSTR